MTKLTKVISFFFLSAMTKYNEKLKGPPCVTLSLRRVQGSPCYESLNRRK